MQKAYRYPGVKPFEIADRDVFFGRDRDRDDLLGLVILEKLVVLFGKSGYGKSSLLNAAITPTLEERGATVLPVRFGSYTEVQPSLTALLLRHLEIEASGIQPVPEMAFLEKICPEKTLWYHAKIRQKVDQKWVFLFDQFEEYFHQSRASRQSFEEQLAELLYTDVPQLVLDNSLDCTEAEMALLVRPLQVHVVFSIRADRLSELNSMSSRLPAILHKRYELRALTREQAREAIEKPAIQVGDFESPPFTYSPEALQTMVSLLSEQHNQALSANSGAGIEAFQLQILCDHIESKVFGGHVSDRKSDGSPEVLPEDLPDFEQVFGEYYNRRLSHLPQEWRSAAHQILEDELLFENELTGDARRVGFDKDVLLQKATTYGGTEALLQALENTFLLRREPNPLGGYNYEISHDTLLAPMLKAKHERKQAERAAQAERERMEALARAREAEEQVHRETVRRRRANMLASAAFFMFFIAAGLGIWAMQERRTAKQRQIEAMQERDNAQRLLEKLQRTEAEKVLLEVNKKLEGAEDMRTQGYYTQYRDFIKKAAAILEKYPENPTLQTKLNEIKNLER